MKKNLVIGNWKMHGNKEQNNQLLQNFATTALPQDVTAAICAPFPYIMQCQMVLEGSCFAWGAQNVSEYDDGAYTGEVSAAMLADLECKFVIVGHSERRELFQETNELIARKAEKVINAGMTPIICIGEKLDEKDSGLTHAVVSEQLGVVLDHLGSLATSIVVAYEPIWAIGTGKTPTPLQAQGVHVQLRTQLIAAGAGDVPILYGGSMNPENAASLLAESDVNGGLIGGASLNAESFLSIVQAAKSLNANL